MENAQRWWLERMRTTQYPLEELETALEDFHASKVIKPILIPGDSSH